MTNLDDAKIVVRIDTKEAEKRIEDIGRKRKDEKQEEEEKDRREKERKSRRVPMVIGGARHLGRMAVGIGGLGVLVMYTEAVQLLASILAEVIGTGKKADLETFLENPMDFVREASAEMFKELSDQIGIVQAHVKGLAALAPAVKGTALSQALLRGDVDEADVMGAAGAAYKTAVVQQKAFELQQRLTRQYVTRAVKNFVLGAKVSHGG